VYVTGTAGTPIAVAVVLAISVIMELIGTWFFGDGGF